MHKGMGEMEINSLRKIYWKVVACSEKSTKCGFKQT